MKYFKNIFLILSVTLLANCASSSKDAAVESAEDVTIESVESVQEAESAAYESLQDASESVESAKEDFQVEDAYSDDSYGESSSASTTNFKNGFYRFPESCTMRVDPSDDSEFAGTIAAQKRLWVEKHDDSWFIVYKKSGPVYVPASCLQM